MINDPHALLFALGLPVQVGYSDNVITKRLNYTNLHTYVIHYTHTYVTVTCAKYHLSWAASSQTHVQDTRTNEDGINYF